jgi:hypothetical protein
MLGPFLELGLAMNFWNWRWTRQPAQLMPVLEADSGHGARRISGEDHRRALRHGACEVSGGRGGGKASPGAFIIAPIWFTFE